MVAQKSWLKALATNSTDAAFTAKVATATEPSGTGVLEMFRGLETLECEPFGAGADNATTAIQIIGWRKTGALWAPTILAELDLILCTAVGVAGYDVAATDRFVDSIVNTNNYGTVVTPTAPANKARKFITDISGWDKIEVLFSRGTATNTNALVTAY
jgi:hypothetical protein